jgi:hypothetical protein
MTRSNTLRTLVASTALAGLAAAPVAALGTNGHFTEGTSAEVIAENSQTAVAPGVWAESDVEDGSLETSAKAEVVGQGDTANMDVTAGMTASDDAEMGIGAAVPMIEEMNALVETGEAIVLTSENTLVGTIEDVEPAANGAVQYEVDLEENFAGIRDSVTLQSRAALDADGVLKVGFSDAELAAVLDQDLRVRSN